jgi:excisionase family DNA binding protein
MSPDQILDRTEACRALGISRQTLISWIHKGKLTVWKRVGLGSNAALLFERKDIEAIQGTSPQNSKVEFQIPPESAVPEIA